MKKILFFALLLFTAACFKEDERMILEPHEGNTKIDTVALTETYKVQIYYNLDSAKVVKTHNKSIWDLGFETGDSTWHIILNTAKFMRAWNTKSTDFQAVKDTIGAKWLFDSSNGHRDSTAIGLWLDTISYQSHNYAYIIDRGVNDLGQLQGFKKLVINGLRNDKYQIRFSDLNGSNEATYEITKNSDKNHVCFSLTDGGQIVDIEPNKNAWDILFTQYSSVLYTDVGEAYPYIVTGVLINPYRVEVAKETTMNFSDIQYENVTSLQYTKIQDIIGYDWKRYDFDLNIYTVNSEEITYIIKAVNGYIFRMRFLGFYNKVGQKGYPSFQFKRL